MDNQQERFEKRMSWLAGIIEGEGWITLMRRLVHQKNKKKTICFTPNIGMTNCDKFIVNEVKNLFDSLNLHYRFQTRIGKIGSDGILRKTRFEISIASMRDIKTLANRILPYMIGEKKNRVHKLFEYFDVRERKGKKGPNSKYGYEEEKIYKELYSYKGKSQSKILNDYTPNMQLHEDIV